MKAVELVKPITSHHYVIIPLGTDTHIYANTHTNVTGKSNFKKPGTCWSKAGAHLVQLAI